MTVLFFTYSMYLDCRVPNVDVLWYFLMPAVDIRVWNFSVVFISYFKLSVGREKAFRKFTYKMRQHTSTLYWVNSSHQKSSHSLFFGSLQYCKSLGWMTLHYYSNFICPNSLLHKMHAEPTCQIYYTCSV